MNSCPCGSPDFETCCMPLHKSIKEATDPLMLMKSRYSAFVKNDAKYLFRTSSKTLKQTLTVEELFQACTNTIFVHLDILQAKENLVEFCATYIDGDLVGRLHELSTFTREEALWKYDTGQLFETPMVRIKRNDLCPCQSGKKFKKCHIGS